MILASFGGHVGGWGPGMWFGPFIPLMWLLVIGLIVLFTVRRRPFNDARRALADRYARGELSSDEYNDRLKHLR